MCRVLIIDNDEAICSLLLYALSRDDIAADIATNSVDGLEKFRQEQFDVVITDMVMPGMDGNNIARRIRNSDRPHTPIIGISETAWLLDESEFDFILGKPFSMRSLLGAVKTLTTTPQHAAA